MSLAPCPDCGNMCSPLANVCPKCGRPFQANDLVISASVETPHTDADDDDTNMTEEEIAAWLNKEESNDNADALKRLAEIRAKQAKKSQQNLVIVAVLFALMALCCLGTRQSQEDIDREFEDTLRWEREQMLK